ncbi:unnamed protein product [Chironomus riparius]|uniref:Lipase domain-containing protein n=1 Tax=Chironomus riparius TaxID=315576 RepID=A0A9N9RRL9_9DIPT|nr:unnamed protein product [Chironomus riparius]
MFGKVTILILALATVVHADNRFMFIFYFNGGIAEYTTSNLQMIIGHPSFVRNGETVMFHYNNDHSLTTPEVREIIQAYEANSNYNFVVVHYPDSSEIGSLSAGGLGDSIGDALIALFNNGYNSGFMNLIGFSLGAQIMARASRRVQDRSNRRHIIGRLTGLDPFNLGAISSVTVGRLSSADAQLVESVHTEGERIGDHESQGHVAFFVNGGLTQPFCTDALPGNRADCSHIFALAVWAESVRSSTPIFPALECATWSRYLGGECNQNSVTNLGRVSNNIILRGSFFLRTNHFSPFSRNTPFP